MKKALNPSLTEKTSRKRTGSNVFLLLQKLITASVVHKIVYNVIKTLGLLTQKITEPKAAKQSKLQPKTSGESKKAENGLTKLFICAI